MNEYRYGAVSKEPWDICHHITGVRIQKFGTTNRDIKQMSRVTTKPT
jgi:hypothetical protein